MLPVTPLTIPGPIPESLEQRTFAETLALCHAHDRTAGMAGFSTGRVTNNRCSTR
jgi:hypothetical protein